MDIGATNGIYYNQIAEKADGNYIVTGQAYGQSMNQIHAFGFDPTGESDCEMNCAGVYHDFTISVASMEQTLLEVMNDGSVLTGGYLTSQDFTGENMFLVKLLTDVQLADVNNFGGGANILLYPNPTSNNFTIDGVNASDVLNVTLMDMNGRILQTWNGAASSSYELNNVSTGNYIVQLVTNKGTATKRIAVN